MRAACVKDEAEQMQKKDEAAERRDACTDSRERGKYGKEEFEEIERKVGNEDAYMISTEKRTDEEEFPSSVEKGLVASSSAIDCCQCFTKQELFGGPTLLLTSQEHTAEVQAPVHEKLYIILDLNGVLIKRWEKRPPKLGLVKQNRKWIQLRPGCVDFLRKVFVFFHVGIWSTMQPANVINICSTLEEQAHQKLPFFMLWSQDECYRHKGIRRPDKSSVAADFKPLSRVWQQFCPKVACHNTVLIDDSPYKACINNPNNCIFPEPFEGNEDDSYLNAILLPYLEKMIESHDIRDFIANNRIGQPPVTIGHEFYPSLYPMKQECLHSSLPSRFNFISIEEEELKEKVLSGYH